MADTSRQIDSLLPAPEEYLPRAAWYGQFLGKNLDDRIRIKQGIRGITGATLSATRSAR